MVAKRAGADPIKDRKRVPASTPEQRDLQLISLAYDTVEKKMKDGTATATEIVHFLKLGAANTQLEIEQTKLQNELLVAKTESMASGKRIEELYSNALEAMRAYSGQDEVYDEDL